LPYNMASATLTIESNDRWRHCHLMYVDQHWLVKTSIRWPLNYKKIIQQDCSSQFSQLRSEPKPFLQNNDLFTKFVNIISIAPGVACTCEYEFPS